MPNTERKFGVNVSLDSETIDLLDEAASAQDLSRSEYLRKLIRETAAKPKRVVKK